MEAEERVSKTLHHFPRLHPPASSICLQYDGFGANHPGLSDVFRVAHGELSRRGDALVL